MPSAMVFGGESLFGTLPISGWIGSPRCALGIFVSICSAAVHRGEMDRERADGWSDTEDEQGSGRSNMDHPPSDEAFEVGFRIGQGIGVPLESRYEDDPLSAW